MTPWTAAHQVSLSFTISWSLLKLMSIESVMPSNHLILCYTLQSFPASKSFLLSRLFASGGQSTGASALASVLPMNIQGWFPFRFEDLISLQSKRLSIVLLNITVQKHQFFVTQPSLWFSSHVYYLTTGKTMALSMWTFVDKVMSLFFNTLSRFVIAFLQRSKRLLILWL